VQEAILGEPRPALLLSQAWFWKDAAGRQQPGFARLQIWRETPSGWTTTRLEDGDSNVFHKAILRPEGLLTIAGEKALLKRWTLTDGKWAGQVLWERDWGGAHSRLRDLEIGDVDGDGREEYVLATHDQGVVAVYCPAEGGRAARVVELDRRPNTFVHEIEIGDIDGDGRLEFFATPSERNRLDAPQSGQVVMYRWDGKAYRRSVVEAFERRHAKEILVADTDGDGRGELFAAVEAEPGPERSMVKPVEIRCYRSRPGGRFSSETVATIPDWQARCMVAADFDGDGRKEVVVTTMKKGLFLLEPPLRGQAGRPWKITCFDAGSSGYEHAAVAADLDGDGIAELYVAADDQGALDRYVWDRGTGAFRKTRLGPIDPGGFTWSIAAGRL
jgi:hypothetical protein